MKKQNEEILSVEKVAELLENYAGPIIDQLNDENNPPLVMDVMMALKFDPYRINFFEQIIQTSQEKILNFLQEKDNQPLLKVLRQHLPLLIREREEDSRPLPPIPTVMTSQEVIQALIAHADFFYEGGDGLVQWLELPQHEAFKKASLNFMALIDQYLPNKIDLLGDAIESGSETLARFLVQEQPLLLDQLRDHLSPMILAAEAWKKYQSESNLIPGLLKHRDFLILGLSKPHVISHWLARNPERIKRMDQIIATLRESLPPNNEDFKFYAALQSDSEGLQKYLLSQNVEFSQALKKISGTLFSLASEWEKDKALEGIDRRVQTNYRSGILRDSKKAVVWSDSLSASNMEAKEAKWSLDIEERKKTAAKVLMQLLLLYRQNPQWDFEEFLRSSIVDDYTNENIKTIIDLIQEVSKENEVSEKLIESCIEVVPDLILLASVSLDENIAEEKRQLLSENLGQNLPERMNNAIEINSVNAAWRIMIRDLKKMVGFLSKEDRKKFSVYHPGVTRSEFFVKDRDDILPLIKLFKVLSHYEDDMYSLEKYLLSPRKFLSNKNELLEVGQLMLDPGLKAEVDAALSTYRNSISTVEECRSAYDEILEHIWTDRIANNQSYRNLIELSKDFPDGLSEHYFHNIDEKSLKKINHYCALIREGKFDRNHYRELFSLTTSRQSLKTVLELPHVSALSKVIDMIHQSVNLDEPKLHADISLADVEKKVDKSMDKASGSNSTAFFHKGAKSAPDVADSGVGEEDENKPDF